MKSGIKLNGIQKIYLFLHQTVQQMISSSSSINRQLQTITANLFQAILINLTPVMQTPIRAAVKATTQNQIRNNTKTNQPDMKCCYILSLITIALILSGGTGISAQTVTNSTSALVKGNLKQDSVNTFISFSPVFSEGKTYVRWLVKNDKKDGVFVVERSADGVEFEALGFKDRVGTDLSVNLFYSFVDAEPIAGDNHYRVMQVGADNTYRYSSVVKVSSPTSPIISGSVVTTVTDEN